MKHLKYISITGIIIYIFYFVTTVMLILTKEQNWLKLMEISTILGGIFMVIWIVSMPYIKEKAVTRLLAIIFASSCMLLTCIAHILNLTVVNPLIANGINVPVYFRIGQWPSFEMALDYLGWGFFMGISFILSFLSMNDTVILSIKRISLINGICCILGYFGSVMISPNFWYIAPMGYGVGMFIICIKMAIQYRSK